MVHIFRRRYSRARLPCAQGTATARRSEGIDYSAERRACPVRLGLYKILFYFEAFVRESIILLLPPPTCTARTIAMLLHIYCAIYDAPATPHLYAMHNTILPMTISC